MSRMPRLTFPVAGGNNACFPKEALCPMCKSAKVHEPHSMAIVNLGAILMTNRDKGAGTMSGDLDGFLRLIWHGAHQGGTGKDVGISAHLDIVEDVCGGQADLYFCSTACLRAFFNACVDEFERKIEEVKSGNQ
jgi:hypothetical protein